ncbi:hypothetical protein GCM10009680_02650 [Streptomyces yatensis]|uniref:Uncharacterized protein n=1 Tax=Streptomyces yatensis TaxID=155177 RepID=A0ABP4SA73_9ACTN
MSTAVLTLVPPGSAHTSARLPLAFHCAATAHDLSGAREVVLATYRAPTPRLAVRWMQAEALRLARLLDPHPGEPYLGRAPVVPTGPMCPRPHAYLYAWAREPGRYEQALFTLAAAESYRVSVADYDARYNLLAAPLLIPPMPPPPHSPAGCQPSSARAGRRRRKPARHAAR